MNLELLIIICSLLITNSQQHPNAHRSSKKLRITGGSAVIQGEFPFMVAVLYKGLFTCGGSIISAEWVLTAAHCVYNRTSSQFSILSGTIYMDGESGEVTPVSQVIYHEQYTPTSNLANDIAVLRLSIALDFDGNVQPVTLPTYQEAVPDYAETSIMGWGYEQYNGTPSSTLQKATVYVIPNDICYIPYSYYAFYILSSNLCAGTPQGGVGQCTGDSGGPMIYSGDPTFTQIAIVSFSAKPCGSVYFPGVYTRVCLYRNWIKTKCGV